MSICRWFNPRTFMIALPFMLSVIIMATAPARADEVRIDFNGTTLNAEMSFADEASLRSGVVLIVHGTLAHNAMETIATLAGVLNERGYNTLAINLSLGVNDRHGMYDCATPHRHRHLDALDEIDAWMAWLQDHESGPVILLGHSRGGNQVARYAAERGHELLHNVVLMAPATWSAEKVARDYEKSHGAPLADMLKKAEAQIDAGHGGDFLEGAGLLYCPDSDVTADSFVSYYLPDPRFDTPQILHEITLPVLVIAGTEDTVVSDLAKKVGPLADGKHLVFAEVEGADHFFLNLFADDVADLIEENAPPPE